MRRNGHLIVTLRSGEARPHVPAQADCLLGACRPVNFFDDDVLDRTLQRRAGAFRVTGSFHARRSLGLIGSQNANFDTHEESLGLSRTYRIELADPAADLDTLQALRNLTMVESAIPQLLSWAPLQMIPPVRRRLTRVDARRPFLQIRASEALARESGDAAVTVAVVDTGVALGHEELRRKLLAGYDTVDLGLGHLGGNVRLQGDSWGRDFTPHDETGHGSHVAGIIGARGWRIEPGLAGKCLLLPIRVLAAALSGPGPEAPLVGIGALGDIDAGIKVAVDLGADVINLSLGTPASSLETDSPTPHSAVVRYAFERGTTLIAAAGNSGQREKFFPAALPEVIAVGSVDKDGRRSQFSTWGDHLALSAPGEDIISLGQRGYRLSSGTSHAAPFVSGTASLLISRARRAGRTLAPGDVRRHLVAGTTKNGSAFDPQIGFGVLDSAASLADLENELASPAKTGGSTRSVA